MSYTETLTHQPESPIYQTSSKTSRTSRSVLRVSTNAMRSSHPFSPETSAGSSSSSSSRTRTPSKGATVARNAGKGHADASFPTPSPSAAHISPRPLPATQPTVRARGSTPAPRSHHQRAHTTTAAPPPSSLAFPRTHTRTSSSASHTIHDTRKTPRARVLSLSALAAPSDAPKAEALTPIAVPGEETIGSFAPTSCPRQHMQSVLGSMPRPRFFSFARHRLAINDRPSPLRMPHTFDQYDDTSSLEDNSPPDSPLPSICRTPSSESQSGSDYCPTAPSSAGPSTPILGSSAAPSIRHITRTPSHSSSLSTPAVLAALEDKSKFR
ncbi:hypothetical protein EIP91_002580, partial [Steccherinum ochraceum]